MSLVVFPFKEEDLRVVARNLGVAAHHPGVREVWAVAAAESAAMAQVSSVAAGITTPATPVRVFPQERMGTLRSGKGDGMNTALALAAERGFERVHFYDADITNFDTGWIDGAELHADQGFGVVRHRFPRAATDAMITWMVTRPGLALLFPGTVLPRLGQPLGGELLLSAEAVRALAADPFVTRRSDWGIDTVITHATTTLDVGIYEHNIPDGKRHALYGSLTEIRDMVLECLDAVSSLAGRQAPNPELRFETDPPAEVPADLKRTVGYDIDSTRAALGSPPSPGERRLLVGLGLDPDRPLEMSHTEWRRILPVLVERFDLADQDWRDVVFRLWVERVIHYTLNQVPAGYDAAIAYLEGTIEDFESGD